MTEEVVCVGVDIAKNTLDVAVSNLKETRQFNNDYEGITSPVRYIARLKPTRVILEATGNYEMPLAASLQSNHLPVIIVNHGRCVISPGRPEFWPRPIELMPGFLLSSACR